MVDPNGPITRKEFHAMEIRIIGAINEVKIQMAAFEVQIEANRKGVLRVGGVNTVLTAIGSTIAAVVGMRD